MDTASDLHPLEQLARFCQDFQLNQASEATRSAVELCAIDTIGCAYGATQYEEIPRVMERLMHWHGLEARENPMGLAQLWFDQGRVDIPLAVYCNAMLTHALELDDVHRKSKSHVGAVVIPVAFTLAQALKKDGRALKEAIICGYEVMSRVGMAMDVSSNRVKGWHTTSIIGPFGAAAAAGKLLGFNQEQYISAFGLAGTQSSGLWAFLKDGATCKKMHVAHAAWSGIMACILTEGGMIGPKFILDAVDGGLYQAVSDSHNMNMLVEGLGNDYAIDDIDRKLYPCCRSTHPIIDSALALRRRIEAVEDIKSIDVFTYEVGVIQCGMPEYPTSPTQAKFSSAYVLACALLFGRVDEECFSPGYIERTDVRTLFDKITVLSGDKYTEQYPDQWGCETIITMRDGQKVPCEMEAMRGSPQNPLTADDIAEKFRALVEPVQGKEGAKDILDDIRWALNKGHDT